MRRCGRRELAASFNGSLIAWRKSFCGVLSGWPSAMSASTRGPLASGQCAAFKVTLASAHTTLRRCCPPSRRLGDSLRDPRPGIRAATPCPATPPPTPIPQLPVVYSPAHATAAIMSTQQQAMIMETLLALRRTVKRRAYGPPSSSSSDPSCSSYANCACSRLGFRLVDRPDNEPRQQAEEASEVRPRGPPDLVHGPRRIQGGRRAGRLPESHHQSQPALGRRGWLRHRE
jgi:hypothetical protein